MCRNQPHGGMRHQGKMRDRWGQGPQPGITSIERPRGKGERPRTAFPQQFCSCWKTHWPFPPCLPSPPFLVPSPSFHLISLPLNGHLEHTRSWKRCFAPKKRMVLNRKDAKCTHIKSHQHEAVAVEEGTRLFSCSPTTLNHTPDDWNPAQKSLESQMVFNRPPQCWVCYSYYHQIHLLEHIKLNSLLA